MANSALLVMDLQVGLVDRFPDSASLLDRLRLAIDTARNRDIPVIFVRVGFRPGTPEVSPRNKSFSAVAALGGHGESDPATQIHPALGARPEDPIVVKRRVSAFTGSDLEVLLRSLGVDHLVLSGIATSGVVLSTIREAADRDYQLTVLRDGCADADEEVHRVLLDKVFARHADVVTIADWSSERR